MWGDGYLAPGGPEEIEELLEGVSVAGLDVLDIGSGLGAAGVLLAEMYGAKNVVGIDVEEHLIAHSQERAAKAGLAQQVSFHLVEPGPLIFPDASFDVVFTKDVIVHVPDKIAMYEEVKRVLKPGGAFVGSDWLRGGEETRTPVAEQWLEFVHLDFQLQDLESTAKAIESVGFEDVRLNDRNAWYREDVCRELETLRGEKYAGLVERIGEEKAAYRLKSSELRKEVLDLGFLRPTHFVAYKPRS
jgi:phosphoethanolamine N-methyltransferase